MSRAATIACLGMLVSVSVLAAAAARAQVVSGPLQTAPEPPARPAQAVAPADPNDAPPLSGRIAGAAEARQAIAGRPATPGRGPAWHTARTGLDAVGLSVNYLQTPIAEVLDDLRNDLDLNIVAYWPSLRLAGIDPDTPVTLTLNNVSGQSILTQALAYLGSSHNTRIDWQLDADGIITIDRSARITEKTYTRMYNVGDLTGPRSTGYSRYGAAGYGAYNQQGGQGQQGLGRQGQPGQQGQFRGYGGTGRSSRQGWQTAPAPARNFGGYSRFPSDPSANYRGWSPAPNYYGYPAVTDLNPVLGPGIGMYEPAPQSYYYSAPNLYFRATPPLAPTNQPR